MLLEIFVYLIIKMKNNMFSQGNYCVFFVVLRCVLWQIVVINLVHGIESKDYCQWETFNPECGNNEVVFVDKAIFGIMEKGRCIERDYGYLGCSSDQLGFMDKMCSGKRSCSIDIGSKDIISRISCPVHYLEASYNCLKVMTTENEKCYQSMKIEVKYTKLYLASILTKEKMCGSGNTPWILQAQSGQMINLTLVDFSWGDEVSVNNNECQRQYGHILRYDNNEVLNICGGLKREVNIGVIKFHQLQIVLMEAAVQSYNFLIRYQAIGCPDIVPPKNAWMRKQGNDVTIGCHSSSDNWKLKCVGNHWIGVVGNCSIAKQPVSTVEEEIFSKHHVLAVAVGCVALIICCVTITVGAYYIRRYKLKMKSKSSTQISADNTMYLLPPKQSNVAMRTLSQQQPQRLPGHSRQGSMSQTLPPHPELQGLHMCGPNCNCTLSKQDKEKDYTDDSVLYYVLEQPPIYANSDSSTNVGT